MGYWWDLIKGPCTISIDKRSKLFQIIENWEIQSADSPISKICEKKIWAEGWRSKLRNKIKILGNIKDSFEILTVVPQPKLFFSHIFEISLKIATCGLFFALDLIVIVSGSHRLDQFSIIWKNLDRLSIEIVHGPLMRLSMKILRNLARIWVNDLQMIS